MVLIEELLLKLKEKLDNNQIKSSDVKNFSNIYSLELEKLEELINIEWKDKKSLEQLIETFSLNQHKFQQDKIELLKQVINNTDYKKDQDKMDSCFNVINRMDEFEKDNKITEKIVDRIMNSQTNEAVVFSKKLINSVLDIIKEEEYDEQTVFAYHIRLLEILNFVTKEKENKKVDIIDEIYSDYPKNKIGTFGGIVYGIVKSKNYDQVSAIVDVVNNKNVEKSGITFKTCLIASTLSNQGLVELSDVLDYSDVMTNQELNDEIEKLFSEDKAKVKTRKMN